MTTRPATETDLTRFYELFPQPGLARDLFNIVEGHRVDAAIRRAYPGIRRDMALIQAASAERRPELATLSDSQAVVEALLQHTLGLTPDRSEVAEATQHLIVQAVAMLAAVEEEDARVGDAAALTGRLYRLIDEGLADPGRALRPDAEGPPPQGAPPEGSDPDGDPAPSGGADDYEQLELPPFMTPVMEQLVRPPSDAPAAREAQMEPQPNGDQSADQTPEAEDADAAASTSEAEAGQGSPDEVAQQTASEGQEEAPGGRRRRALRRRRGRRLGLPRAVRPGGGPPRRARGGRRRGPRRAGLPLRRVGPQDRGLPPGLVHPHRAPPDPHPGGLRRRDLLRVRRRRHPDPAQLPAHAPGGAAQDAPARGRRRPRHRRPGRVRR